MPRCMSTLRVHHLNAIAASGQKQCHSQKVAQRNNICNAKQHLRKRYSNNSITSTMETMTSEKVLISHVNYLQMKINAESIAC